MNFVPFIGIGFSSLLLQITVLRLLLSTFSGNELDIGITLSFWLVYIAAGSYIGRKIRHKHALALSFLIIALLIQPTVFAIKIIRPLLSLGPGEVVSLSHVLLSTSLILLPLCFVTGTQFPLAVAYLNQRNATAKVYGFEAIGAAAGGILFTFVLSSRVDTLTITAMLSILSIMITALLLQKKYIVLAIIIPLTFLIGFHQNIHRLAWHNMEVSYTAESRYGEITVLDIGDQKSVYVNGHLYYSYPDVQTEEIKSHLPMLLHPTPQEILVIGGSPGILKELLKYQVHRIDFVELDSTLTETSMKILSSPVDVRTMSDSHVNIINMDGRKYLRTSSHDAYDIIILNVSQPTTASINRFYTTDFFIEAKRILRKNGILAMHILSTAGYIGRAMQITNGSIYYSLNSVFPHVAVTSQDYGALFASPSPVNTNPVLLEQSFSEKGIATRYFSQYLVHDIFSPFNVGYVEKRLKDVHVLNSDERPSAYMYNIFLWSEMHGGRALRYLIEPAPWQAIMMAIAGIIVVLFTMLREKRTVYLTIYTTGFASMTFVVSVILLYQARYGYVYEMIGLLTAMFMIGLWLGTRVIRNSGENLPLLLLFDLAFILLALTCSFFFITEALFYVFILLAGMLTGAQFCTASFICYGPESPGKLYGLELLGSFLGAFLTSIMLVPLFGTDQTFLFVAMIKIFSTILILSLFCMLLIRNERLS